MKPTLAIPKSPEQAKKEQREAKLNAIADKKKTGKLTLEDLYEQNQIIIELLKASR